MCYICLNYSIINSNYTFNELKSKIQDHFQTIYSRHTLLYSYNITHKHIDNSFLTLPLSSFHIQMILKCRYIQDCIYRTQQKCNQSPDTPVSSINKPDYHDITEILLKVVLNTITITYSSFPIIKSLH